MVKDQQCSRVVLAKLRQVLVFCGTLLSDNVRLLICLLHSMVGSSPTSLAHVQMKNVSSTAKSL
jgi:hypothetical protein